MHGNPPQEVAGPLPTSADRSATKAVLPRNRGIPSVFDEDFAQQRAREPAPGEGVVGFEPLEAGRHVGEAGDRGAEGREPGSQRRPARGGVEILGERRHRAAVRVEITSRVAARGEKLDGAGACSLELVLVEIERPACEQDERDLDLDLVAFGQPLLELREEGALRRIVHAGPAYDGHAQRQTPDMSPRATAHVREPASLPYSGVSPRSPRTCPGSDA